MAKRSKPEKEQVMETATEEQVSGQKVNTPIVEEEFRKPEVANRDKYMVESVEVNGDTVHLKGAINCPIKAAGHCAHWKANVDLNVPINNLVREYIRQMVYGLDGKVLPGGPIPSVITDDIVAEYQQRTSGGGASAIGPEFHARAKALNEQNVGIPSGFEVKAGKGGKWTASCVKAVYDSGDYAKFNQAVDAVRKALEKSASGGGDDLFG